MMGIRRSERMGNGVLFGGISLAMALFLPAMSQAAIVAQYPFTGSSPASTDTEVVTTASDLGIASTFTTPFVTSSGGNLSPAMEIRGTDTASSTQSAQTSEAAGVDAGD